MSTIGARRPLAKLRSDHELRKAIALSPHVPTFDVLTQLLEVAAGDSVSLEWLARLRKRGFELVLLVVAFFDSSHAIKGCGGSAFASCNTNDLDPTTTHTLTVSRGAK